jgi:hypothetical protein
LRIINCLFPESTFDVRCRYTVFSERLARNA